VPRKPLVTVLMSVYNDRRFLPDAVDSILRQSLDEFEFIIIDDGSTDRSAEYVEQLGDPRIHFERNPKNLGLTRSLNHGLTLASGRYLARMDSDDVAMRHRLRHQAQFLDAHPEVGIVGSSRVLIDESGAAVAHAPAVEADLRIRWKCLLGNPFAHPAVMLRLEVLDDHRLHYDEQYRTAQDYDLWSRLLTVARGHNLTEPLLRYRLRDGVSRMHKTEQMRNHDIIAHASIQRLVPGFQIGREEVTQLRGRFGGHSVREPDMDPTNPRWAKRYLELLLAFAARYGSESGVGALIAEVRGAVARAA
jgi:glycosyltransferase involved in cell wall biosynthesis